MSDKNTSICVNKSILIYVPVYQNQSILEFFANRCYISGLYYICSLREYQENLFYAIKEQYEQIMTKETHIITWQVI